jgi:hypothetical protein
MSLFLSIILTVLCAFISITCASVLLVRFLNTRVLVIILIVNSTLCVYSCINIWIQFNIILDELSPLKIIQSIDLFS